MSNVNDLYQAEKNLKALRSLLQSHERKLAIQAARWDEMLSKVPEWKRIPLEETIEKQKARGNHELSVLQHRIADLEASISKQYEEMRQQEAARAWLKPIKEQALESWLHSGGTAAGFESSWPEMEKKILMQNTLDSLDTQPQQPDTKRTWHSWDPIKPPPEPKKKKLH